MLSAAEIAVALGGKRAGQGRYVAKCPAHEDRSPSLSLRDTDDGRASCFTVMPAAIRVM